jgi:O-methyltransferase
MKQLLRRLVRATGFDVVRAQKGPAPVPADIGPAARALIDRVRPYTMTSPERLYALIEAVRYVSAAGLRGAFVECGVWRGGSMLAAALTLQECGERERELYLFDTFEGMSEPTEADVAIDGASAATLLRTESRSDPQSAWCYATLDDVQATLAQSGYDGRRVHYVKGKVEETIPAQAPLSIALLRLDTDWYESTRHELEHLYPRLVPGGVLIIDDYGHWAGARKAVDEYLAAQRIPLLLHRIDYTGRMAVKPA